MNTRTKILTYLIILVYINYYINYNNQLLKNIKKILTFSSTRNVIEHDRREKD